MDRPRVILGRSAPERMTRGAVRMARLVGVTLGPKAGNIVNDRGYGTTDRVETLTDAATIARRVIQLPGAVEDVGAMVMRQVVWRQRDKFGDGSATAAVLTSRLLQEGRRMVVAGVNPMRLQRGIESGVAAAARVLAEMAEPLEGQERLAALATAATGDAELGKIVGEVFETIGADGVVTVQDYIGYYLNREYVEGARFKGNLTSRFFLTNPVDMSIELVNPYICVTDWNLSTMEQVRPLLELVLSQGDKRPLLVLCDTLENQALATLLANHQKNVLQICGVVPGGYGEPHRASLEDIALLTGGHYLPKQILEGAFTVALSDLGQAGRVQVNGDNFIIMEGGGDRKKIRERRQTLRAMLPETPPGDALLDLRERLQHFSGGVAILGVGAPTEKERDVRRKQAEEAVAVVQAGAVGGVVPGGGAAYLSCIPALEALAAQEPDADVRFGILCVARTLEEPLRCIVGNAALEPSVAVMRCRERGRGYGMDVRTGEIADMKQVGIMDSTRILQKALEGAASAANMVLTIGAIVLHREPKVEANP
jgi:chaperonin GroEL